MNCNTQNAKLGTITEKTLVVGIDVGSEMHYARAFDWRGYEYSTKAFQFSNTEAGFRPVLVNPHHVKKSKELDDNNPSKNDRKDPKVIAGLINEGRFSTHTFRKGSMQNYGVRQIFDFRHRRNLHES